MTHQDMYETWRLLYHPAWSKYQNAAYPEQSSANLVVLTQTIER
jgi:hypothetical protein